MTDRFKIGDYVLFTGHKLKYQGSLGKITGGRGETSPISGAWWVVFDNGERGIFSSNTLIHAPAIDRLGALVRDEGRTGP